MRTETFLIYYYYYLLLLLTIFTQEIYYYILYIVLLSTKVMFKGEQHKIKNNFLTVPYITLY